MKKAWLTALLLIPSLALASVTVTVNGTNYTIPQTNEKGWGTNVTTWIQAASQHLLQKTGGTFTLSAETDFGATYGLKSAYLKSESANLASAGWARLANTDAIGWRNLANSADLSLLPNGNNLLQFNSIELVNLSATQTLTNKTLTSPTITTPTLTVKDNAFTVQANADTTKQLNLSLTGITTGNTRTLTVPDASTTIVGTDATQTLTNKTIAIASNTISGTASQAVITNGSGNLATAATLGVANGGTGQSTLAIHGVVIGNAASGVSVTSVGTSGQVLTGNTGADPTFQAVPAPVLTNVAKTTTYTLTNSDDIVRVSAASAWTLTLHDATTATSKVYRIKRTDNAPSNAITINTTSAQTIDGNASGVLKLYTLNEEIEIYPDGANWQVLAHKTISPWVTYALTIGATTTPPTKGTTTLDVAQWRRVGDSMEWKYQYRQTAAGSAGSGNYKFPLPTGTTIDTTKVVATSESTSNYVYHCGTGVIANNGSGRASTTRPTLVYLGDSTNFEVAPFDLSGTALQDSQSTLASGSAIGNLGLTTVSWSFMATVPITGWWE